MDEEKSPIEEQDEVIFEEDGTLVKEPSNEDTSSTRSTHESGDEETRPVTPMNADAVPSADKELPHRPGIFWKIGSRVEAKDFLDKWYPAKIADVDKSDLTVLIHFEGWNQRYDEWLSMNSEDIRPSTRHSERSKGKTRRDVTMSHKPGEYVFAKWTDCRMYPARVTRVNNNAETYEVLFYDGVRKTVQAINVRGMSLEVQQEYSKVGLLPDVNRKRPKDTIIDEKLLTPLLKEASLKAEKSVKDEEQLIRKEGKRKRSSVDENSGSTKRPKTDSAAATAATAAAKSHTTETTTPRPKQRPEKEKASILSTSCQGNNEVADDEDDGAFLPPMTSLDSSMSSVSSVTSDKDMKVAPPAVDIAIPILTNELLASKIKVARKEFKVEEDHNQFKCPHADCGKSFRKKSLVDCHIKHYHPADLPPVLTPQPTPQAAPPRRRKQTVSMCSTDSDISIGTSAVAAAAAPTTVTPSGGGGGGGGGRSRRKRETAASLSSLPGTEETGAVMDAGDSGLREALQEAVPSRRQSAPAEVTSKVITVPITDDITEADDVEDSTSAPSKDEVVNCICRHSEETGLMIQCEVCLCWQHANCVQLSEGSLPRKYVCWLCLDPPGIRQSARYQYDQDWLWHGSMATFGFLQDTEDLPSTRQREQIMSATHSLIADTHGVNSALNTIRRQIHMLSDKNAHPELLAWARSWQREKAESASETKTEPIEPVEDWMKIEHTMNEKTCHENDTTLIGSIRRQVDVAVGEDNDTEQAFIERHLLDRIDQSHLQIEANLDLIEQQITILEAGEDSGNGSTTDHSERTVRSLRQLMFDLSDVRKIATFH